MAKMKNGVDLRQKIIDTAWELFYKNGYENTTVNDIIREVGTSKGGFYYYFKAKEDLLNSLYSVFDREYEKFYENMDQNQESLVKLKQLSQYVSYFIEANVSAELLAALYQSQLAKKSQDCFLNPNRYYIKIKRNNKRGSGEGRNPGRHFGRRTDARCLTVGTGNYNGLVCTEWFFLIGVLWKPKL